MTTNRKSSMKLMNRLRLSMIINFTFLTMFLVTLGLYISDHNTNVRIQDSLYSENKALIDKVSTIASEKDSFYKEVREDNIILSSNGAILCYMVDILSNQNEQLMKQYTDQSEELKLFTVRDELFDKYDYAIIRQENGTRTDLTYDQLLLLEDLCNNSIVNDPDLFLAWIMTESKGVEDAKNSTSSARGYGQFINSTSKWVYEDLCEKPKWTSSVALDGDTNIEMMVKYVEYLYIKHDGDINKVIDSYRGAHSDSYVATINSYLSTKGKSIDTISSTLKDQFEED